MWLFCSYPLSAQTLSHNSGNDFHIKQPAVSPDTKKSTAEHAKSVQAHGNTKVEDLDREVVQGSQPNKEISYQTARPFLKAIITNKRLKQSA